MGVERSVTRWYLQRQLIIDEIAQLEVKQEPISNEKAVVEPEDESVTDGKESQEAVGLQLTAARRKLKALGHCPKPMMG